VPFIAAGPGIQPGRAPGNAYLLDLLATCCDFAGITPPESNEGLSLRPVLAGHQQTVRNVMYGAYSGGAKPGIRCVREGDWKLITYSAPERNLHEIQLFNLAKNPHELLPEHHADDPAQTNLAPLPEYAEKLQHLQQLLASEMQRLDDPN
jgi:arylsulfatase A-like enzyme